MVIYLFISKKIDLKSRVAEGGRHSSIPSADSYCSWSQQLGLGRRRPDLPQVLSSPLAALAGRCLGTGTVRPAAGPLIWAAGIF